MGWMVLYNVLEVLKWLIIARALMSWFVDPRSGHPVVVWIRNVTDAVLRPFQAVLPSAGGFDLAPIVAIFLIVFMQRAIASGPVGY